MSAFYMCLLVLAEKILLTRVQASNLLSKIQNLAEWFWLQLAISTVSKYVDLLDFVEKLLLKLDSKL